MNPIGIGILVFGAYFGYRGFQRGLVDEVGRLVGLVAAVLLAYRLSPLLAERIGLANELARSAAAFGLIFIGTLLVAAILTRLVRTLVELVLLEWLDRLGGTLFGVLKSLVVLGVLIYILESFETSRSFIERLEQQSFVYRNVVAVKNGLFKALTLDEMIRSVQERMKDVDPEDLIRPLMENRQDGT